MPNFGRAGQGVPRSDSGTRFMRKQRGCKEADPSTLPGNSRRRGTKYLRGNCLRNRFRLSYCICVARVLTLIPRDILWGNLPDPLNPRISLIRFELAHMFHGHLSNAISIAQSPLGRPKRFTFYFWVLWETEYVRWKKGWRISACTSGTLFSMGAGRNAKVGNQTCNLNKCSMASVHTFGAQKSHPSIPGIEMPIFWSTKVLDLLPLASLL